MRDDIERYETKKKHCLWLSAIAFGMAIIIFSLPVTCGCSAIGSNHTATGDNPTIQTWNGITFWQFVAYQAIVAFVAGVVLYAIWQVVKYKLLKPRGWFFSGKKQ